MQFPRLSGILLHPTSLPGRFGIGDLGPETYRFADFLRDAGQRLWQVLPLGPTGYGDSPYQSFSAFAANPLLISLEKLAEDGYLSLADLDGTPAFPDHEVDYGTVIQYKLAVLKKSFGHFKDNASASDMDAFDAFCRENASWLDDYALFMAVKEVHGWAVWSDWQEDIAMRQPAAMADWSAKLGDEIEAHKFWQYEFFKQWVELKQYCHDRDITIMGDIPIYVAHDSADLWVHKDYFYLDEKGNPAVIAGVPPDYFSETGQLWGNPIYRWDVLAATGFQWWIERFRATFAVVDMVRLDHFRGFEAYWEVPATEKTAVVGRWVKGPGPGLFEALQNELGELPIVAENLGVITPEVEAIRNRFGFPGMAIIQFGFGTDPQAQNFLPHRYPEHIVAYTGTHDNDTAVGWWESAGTADSTRTSEDVEREHQFAMEYLRTDGREINWVLIQSLLHSAADTAIIPLQDVLGLGSEARMNLPARAAGNWRWRYTRDMLTDEIRDRLRELTRVCNR